jgi:tripartite-type tricarboxylate transporter receptor subunit TctC
MIVLGILSAAEPSAAQTYPTRPIKVLMAGGPGGPGDTVMRLIGQQLEQRLGQPILIENRPGAGGNLAATATARSDPDGYTLHLAASSLATAPSLYKRLNYDAVRDFAPVTFVGTIPLVLVVNRQFPVRTLAELIALAKAQPGQIAHARTTQGTPSHLGMELLKYQAGIKMREVPYRNNPQAMIDLLSGQVPIFLDFVTSGGAHVRSGDVRALVTTGAVRSIALPDVPAAKESGLPDLEVSTWFGLFAPAATPPDIIAKLNTEMMAVLAMPTVQKGLNAVGVDVTPGGPKELSDYFAAEIKKWREIIDRAGIEKVD